MFPRVRNSHIVELSFDEIRQVWAEQLWPGRISPIETHSAMTWPPTASQPYDTVAFDYPVSFYGIRHDDALIAVNSCHLTTPDQMRSRGLWVHHDHRCKGWGTVLLLETVRQAYEAGASMVWSVPRVAAIPTYQKAGFTVVSQPFDDGVEFGPNVYCTYPLR